MTEESPGIIQPPAQKSLLSRFAHSLYVFGGFFVLLYSLCLVGFSIYALVEGKEIKLVEQLAMSAVGLIFLTASLYVFMGKYRWHAWFTGAVFLLSFILCSAVLITKLLEPEGHGFPELISGMVFCAFMVSATVIKARGHWEARCWTTKQNSRETSNSLE